ncbi:MAG: pilus assembly protein PilP, partial [Gammaproteobacteria bacterium]
VNKMISGIRPNVNRSKEVLENYPLDTLRLIGSLEYKEEHWGLVKAPDGIIYRVKPNNYLGQNYGKVIQVTENKLVLTEIVPDGLGGWEKRQTTLSVNNNE